MKGYLFCQNGTENIREFLEYLPPQLGTQFFPSKKDVVHHRLNQTYMNVTCTAIAMTLVLFRSIV